MPDTPWPLTLRAPYDYPLSARVLRSFVSRSAEPVPVVRLGARVGGRPTVLGLRPSGRSRRRVEVTSEPRRPASEVAPLVRWILSDDQDLRPFYRLARTHKVLGPLTRKFRGLKGTRPASLLEMASDVITEQQISLRAAHAIEERILRRFGDEVSGTWVFPPAGRLADASLENLRHCGLSHRKAEYIRDFARLVSRGELDLERLKELPDDDVRSRLLSIRGWGPWSADYFLIRGLARPDALPSDDLGIRTIIGKHLGRGPRASAAVVERLLEPLRPYRGLAAFYLLAKEMLERGDAVRAKS